MKKQIVKIVVNIVFYLVLAFFIFISFVIFNSSRQGKQPEILGYKFYVVLTGSMAPNINPGDLIIVKNVSANEIEVNDVITFSSENVSEVTTHRVKEIISNDDIEFVTKGDANNVEDATHVKSTSIQGKVIKCMPKAGNKIKFIKKNILAIVIPIIFIISFIALMIKIIKKPKQVEINE